MPPPRSRSELLGALEVAFEALRRAICDRDEIFGALPAVDDWSVRELLAVRVWWTERIPMWIEAGRSGISPPLPAEGFRWTDTPRLNAMVVAASKEETLGQTWGRLEAGFHAVGRAIETLTDRELLETGVFDWADRWPVARWVAINTTRQYTTARTHIRRAARDAGCA